MVPEAEYLTLLNMIKGNDYLKTEKAEKETEISNVLRDPKLSEGTKARKYAWLVKQRRQLKKEIEKPPTIQIDPEQLKTLNTPKYMGVEETTPQQQQQQQSSKKKKKRKKKQEETDVSLDDQLFSTPQQRKSPEKTPTTSPLTSGTQEEEQQQYILHPNQYKDYIKILKQNDKKYKIDKKTGSIFSEFSGPIKDSNIIDIVDYLTGKREDKPPGTDVLTERFRKDKCYKDALNWADQYRQLGEGKPPRRYIKHTKGLVRVKKKKIFKPMIWERLQ